MTVRYIHLYTVLYTLHMYTVNNEYEIKIERRRKTEKENCLRKNDTDIEQRNDKPIDFHIYLVACNELFMQTV